MQVGTKEAVTVSTPAPETVTSTPKPNGSVDSSDFTPEEAQWLESYKLNSIPGSSTPNEVTEKKEDGTEVPVVLKPEEKADPDEVTLKEGQLVDGAGKKVSKVVNHGALHAEREGHKKTKSELQETKTQLQLLLEVLGRSALNPGVAPEKKADAPVDPFDEEDISPDTDLLGAFEQGKRRLKASRKEQLQNTQSAAANTQIKTVLTTYQADAARLKAEDPSFEPAYDHYLSSLRAKYQALGLEEGPDLEKAIQLDELTTIRTAVNGKRSPAETILKLAKAAGWVAPVKTNGATKPAVTPDPKAVEAIETIAKGQQANASLSDLGGSAGLGLTGERLANMSSAEFDRYYEKLANEDPDKLRKLLSGTER